MDAQAQKDASLISIRPDLQLANGKTKKQKPSSDTFSENTHTPMNNSAEFPEHSNGTSAAPKSTPEVIDEPLASDFECALAMPNPEKPTIESNESDYQDLNEDEIQVLKKAQEKRRAWELKKKEGKSAIHNGIAELRETLPTAVMSVVTPKCKPETENSQPVKRSKFAIGGLDTDWKKTVYGHKKAATSRSSLASSDAMTLDVEFEEAPGEFDGDAEAESVAAEREGKSSKGTKAKTASKVVEDIKLEPANVNLIEAEERTTGKPAQPKTRHQTSKADLPIILQTDHNIWANSLLPDLLEWCGMQRDQFGINGTNEFCLKLHELWMDHFGALPHITETVIHNGHKITRADHPAIYSYLGQNALKFVTDEIERFKTVNERQELVEGLLQNNAFLFEFPGPTFLHQLWVALALSTAAVEHALTICQTGEPPKHKTTRNSDESFSEERAPNVAKFFRLAEELKPAKWDKVFSAAEIHLLTVPKAGAGPELKKLLKEASGKNPVAAATEVVEDDPFVVSD
ncbi:hypothetical protein BT96DRAFT_951034 [Gymnopus androsaceus JB14]|uniref:Uncharacterized protein n=1 Tax=Gymnopus androsaceus JB14 TaxID=1447944 RepID=A0A6A4GED3_9AGAR|nr:hypothetical protein BT96DRAFT_951034 [Gymnopus androsaceus JB14]